MPCNSIRRLRVAIVPIDEKTFDIGKVDQPLLKKALTSLDVAENNYTLNGTRLTVRARGEVALTIDQIKVAYSKQVVKSAATRFNWKVQTQSADGQRVVVVKR